VDVVEGKTVVYCFDWKRMIRVKTGQPVKMGDEVLLGFYANSTRASWKKRIVYRLEVVKSLDTGSQG